MVIKLCNCGSRPKTSGICTKNKHGLVLIQCPACLKYSGGDILGKVSIEDTVNDWNFQIADMTPEDYSRVKVNRLNNAAMRMETVINGLY